MNELIGFILPPIIDLINKKIANSRTRFVVSLVLCVLVAVGVNYKNMTFGSELLASVALIFTEAQFVYNLYWKKSLVRARFLSQ